MKKALCSLLIVAILMNFIMCSISYAEGQNDGTEDLPDSPYINKGNNTNTLATPSEGIANSLIYDGTTSTKKGRKFKFTY